MKKNDTTAGFDPAHPESWPGPPGPGWIGVDGDRHYLKATDIFSTMKDVDIPAEIARLRSHPPDELSWYVEALEAYWMQKRGSQR